MTCKPIKRWLSWITAAILCVVGVCGPASGFSEVVVFGDSLSDVGNISAATFGIVPGSGYFDGRFSDGPVWVETLADDLGLDASTRWGQGGTNYAYGGAVTGPGISSLFIRNIGNQIGQYLNAHTPTGDELFVVWGGANNFFDGETDASAPVADLTDHLTELAGAGASEFLVPNLPPLGSVPDFLGSADEPVLNNLAATFNGLLDTTLDDLSAGLGVTIHEFDVATLFADMLADPASFGVTNTADTGIDAPGGTDTSGYLFWDGKHPTALGHNLLAEHALALVTAPVGPLLGDANNDGQVTGADLIAVQQNFGNTGPADGQLPGDANDDGQVTGADLISVQQNFGGTLAPASAGIPEPAALAVWIVIFAGSLKRPRLFG